MSHVSDLRRNAGKLWSGGRGPALFAVAAGWFASLGVRMVYPAMLPHLRSAYGMDLTTGGFLITVLWFAYAVGQLPGGLLTDRLGERAILIISTAVAAAMLVLVVLADSVTIVFAATALFGLGTALYGVARFTAAAALYPDNDGVAIGVTLAAGQVGNSLLPAAAGAIAAGAAWQLGFGFTIPIFVVVAILLWIAVPDSLAASSSAVDSLSADTIRYILSEVSRPAVITVTLILTLGFGMWQAFTGFYPTYLIEAKGLSPTVASALFGFYFALGIVIQPAAGAAYDRFGIRRTLPVLFGIVMTALAALPLLEGFWPLLAVTAVLSFMLGNIAVLLPYLTALLPDDIQGTALGLLRTTYMMIAATSPLFFGVIADHGFFDEAFWLLAAVLVVNTALVLQLPRTD